VTRERADPVVRRFALVTLVLPAAVTVVGLVVQLAVLQKAPGSLSLILTAVLGFGLPAVFGVSCLPSMRRGDRSPSFRLFGAQALGISVLLTIVITSLRPQNVGTTSFDENRVWLPLLAGLVAGVGAAFGGWYLQTKVSRPAPKPAVTPLDLTPGDRVAWLHLTFLPVPAMAVIVAVVTIMGLKAGVAWAAGDRGGIGAILTAIALLLLALLATNAVFRVRVDARGLSVRSVLGIPRFRVAPQEVGSVAVVDARSLGVSGSWGIRILPHRVTIVMRSTTGIRVTRRDGRIFFVTVDDAATAAALLDALAASSAAVAPDAPATDAVASD
jgi:hypothetical protein